MKPKKAGQIFWLIVPFLNKKKWTYPRPFLVYEVNSVDYVLLKISNSFKDYIPQFEFSSTNKPSTLYKKDKKSFVEPNILIYIEHNLFFHKLYETLGLKGQGQSVLPEDFSKISEGVKECFNNEKYRGNRYKIRIL